MKRFKFFRLTHLFLFILLLALVTVAPAAAQEPEGDVEVQVVDFVDFLWNPMNTSVARGDGTVLTKLRITGAQQISGFTLAIAYDASVVSPENVEIGSLLPGTQGVDYFFTIQTGGGGLACDGQTDSSFTVNVAYINPALTINGTGDMLEILWRSDPDAAVGDLGKICLDAATSQVVDNGGLPSVTPVPNKLGTILVEPANIFKFQIGLEGGKNAGLIVPASPDNLFTEVTINGIYPCDGGGVDPLGFCAFNNATALPPYTVEVNRTGYLSAEASFTDPTDSSTIFLWAGDLNDDDVINILDIQLMASLLGAPAGATTLSQAADFTGPGGPPVPDGLINIIDLVLVAKNFGKSGPTDGSAPGGTFPF